MRAREHGFSLVELLVTLAIVALLALVAVPALSQAISALRVDLAAREVTTTFAIARAHAVRLRANVGLKFRTGEDGTVTWGLYRDGDGDGLRSDDIARGKDPAIGAPRRLAHFGREIRFGFPAGRMPRDPGSRKRMTDRDDPIRFNRSDIASFDPLGTATPGSVYVTDGRRHLAAARVLGRTARVQIVTYDPRTETWH